jgi:hypothetical protein
MQALAPGTLEDKRRRRATLRRKTMSIAIDLASIFVMNCLFGASLPLLRSHFSSRRLVVHLAIINSIANVGLFGMNIRIRKQASQRKRKYTRVQGTMANNTLHAKRQQSIESRHESALSVVESSHFAASNKKTSREGLFSSAVESSE